MEHDLLRKNIYIKTEPGGRIVYGELNEEQLVDLAQSLQNRRVKPNLLQLHFNRHGQFFEFEGVTNVGTTGDVGNIGLIHIIKPRISFCCIDNSRWNDGFYFAYLALSKVSIEFDFAVTGSTFKKSTFKEISTPIELPLCVKHHIYGHPRFNIVTGYEYENGPIDDYNGTIVDRGYEQYWQFFKISKGQEFLLYGNEGGVETWGDASAVAPF
jgi:hypothetical protein